MRRWLLPASVVLMLAGHLTFSVWPSLFTIRNDFANYYVPARVVAEGGSLSRAYERDWFQAQVRRAGISRLGGFVPYPPANALWLLPVAGLTPVAAKAIWTALLALALAAAFLVLRPLLPISSWLLALAFLLPSASLRNALLYGQPYPLLLLLLGLSLGALLRGREVLAGLLLSPVLVLKLYGLPFVLFFAWTRRWRAVSGVAIGAALLAAFSLAILGPAVHAAYLREVLPASLRGECQDPYSTTWGSLTTIAHRLFQHEPDLNPHPVADLPTLARALSRGLPVVVVLLSVLGGAPGADATRLRREWAVLVLGSLAASPIPASFHFLLLVLPVGLLLPEAGAGGRAALLAALVFATSPASHYFAPLAAGWANLIAHPRLVVLLVLLAWAVAPILTLRVASLAVVSGLVGGATAVARGPEEPWTRVDEAHGYVLAEPVSCEGGLAWVTVRGEHLVVRAPGGGILESSDDALMPRCVGGRVVTQSSLAAAEMQDEDSSPGVRVRVDRAAEALVEGVEGAPERILARGLVRWPRLSPDGAWVVYQSWESGSWDIRAVARADGRIVRVTGDAANEIEPSWMPEGDRILFASDRRRGLGFTALYSVAFRP